MEKSSFFDSVGYDRKYNSADWANVFDSFATNGIFPSPTNTLQVIADVNMQINVMAGKAFIDGYLYTNTEFLLVKLENANGLLDRIDRVVVQFSKLGRLIKVVVKKGEPSETPIAPIIQRDIEIYELALADIFISKGTTVITQANIVDLRLDLEKCGTVKSTIKPSDEATDFTTIQAQIDAINLSMASIVTNKEHASKGWVLVANGDGTSTFKPSTTKTGVVYGVKIDTTNANPETALVYIDNAIGLTPAKTYTPPVLEGEPLVSNFAYGSWADKFPFNQIKPCLYKNGAVNYYLNPNDYTKKLDGTPSVLNITDGEVVVEFPKIYWKFETIGTDLYIRYSDIEVDKTYKCLAHMRGNTEKDKCYIGAYLSSYGNWDASTPTIYSASGKLVLSGRTLGEFRDYVHVRALEGYDLIGYYQVLMLQVLYTIMFKDRDSQTALGKGYVEATNGSSTGRTNAKGMFYGETTGKEQMKFCGLEDFWGNFSCFFDGLCGTENYNLLIGNENFNNAGVGYTNYGQGATAYLNGRVETVQGGTETGFIVKTITTNQTTHYCDTGILNAGTSLSNTLGLLTGWYRSATGAGVYSEGLHFSDTSKNDSTGARIMIL